MNRTEHLLVILAEECAEVSQRATKAARFGLQECQPGQPLSNEQRIVAEYSDLVAAMEMLRDEAMTLPIDDSTIRPMIAAKKLQVEKFLRYSAKCGTLELVEVSE